MNHMTNDRNGFTPNPSMIGKPFRHAGNGKTYKIIGFTFNCDSDEWAVNYRDEENDVIFSRTVANFFGQRATQRFTSVEIEG